MTSKLVTDLLAKEGLLRLLEERAEGVVPAGAATNALLERAEILALGAAADAARRRECPDEVRIYVPSAPAASDELVVVGHGAPRGTALLRLVAKERLTGPVGRRIVVDLAGAAFIDSTVLGVLLKTLTRLDAGGGGLVLVSNDRRILKVFEVTGLARVFRIEPTLTGAVAAVIGDQGALQ